jgi:Family of unknown function (DUF6229)
MRGLRLKMMRMPIYLVVIQFMSFSMGPRRGGTANTEFERDSSQNTQAKKRSESQNLLSTTRLIPPLSRVYGGWVPRRLAGFTRGISAVANRITCDTAHRQPCVTHTNKGEWVMNGFHAEDLVAQWRSDAGGNNPAGSLFVSGEFAEADIVCETGTGSGKCGTACSGSITRHCC